MQNKKNKRTLKKRIRRIIFLSFFISVTLFGVIILALITGGVKQLALASTSNLSYSIADEINSKGYFKNVNTGINSKSDTNLITKDMKNQWANTIDKAIGIKKTFVPAQIISIDVEVMGTKVYSTQKDDGIIIEGNFAEDLLKYFDVEESASLINAKGMQIGKVTAKVNPDVVVAALGITAVTIIFAVCIALIINSIVSRFFTLPVINPLKQLEAKMDAIAGENFENNINNQIILKKPLREIESLAAAVNIIMNKMKEYTDKLAEQKERLENQNDELEAQNQELVESRNQIQWAQEQIMQRERAVRNLLNSAGQGFLYFGEDMIISPEYSQECVKIFGMDIQGQRFSELIYRHDEEQKKFVENVVRRVFNESNRLKRNIYLPLLPNEILLDERHFQVDYKVLEENEENTIHGLMVILTDITDKRILENRVEEERNILKMVVKVVVNYSDFSESVKDYMKFCSSRINKILNKNLTLEDKVFEIFRNIHTYKGVFSQMDMINIVNHLHVIETQISDIRRNIGSYTLENLRDRILSWDMTTSLKKDMSVLEEILGENFFKNEGSILVDRFKIIEIEKKMLSILSPFENRALLPEIRKLRYRPFKELLKSYPDYVLKLGDRFQKHIKPFSIEGGELLVNNERYSSFAKSLGHVFRNSVDHGIEMPEDRVVNGKDEQGRIMCRVWTENSGIHVDISDDGRGIDVNMVKLKAVQKGIMTKDEITALKDEDALKLIFENEFTTKENVSEFSGRGIGLSAVLNELNNLQGRVEIWTKPGKGTEFHFILPDEDLAEMPKLSVKDIINPLINTSKRFVAEHHGGDILNNVEVNKVEKLHLNKFSVFTNIKGVLNGKIIMSLDEELARMLVRSFVIGELTKEEEDECIEDVASECLNIILGNSLKSFSGIDELVEMEMPITIASQGACVTYPSSQIWTCSMKFPVGNMSMSFACCENLAM